MQHMQNYRQSPVPVNAALRGAGPSGPLRQRGHQTHRVSVLIGTVRVRVSGDFETIMGWVRLALAEREVAA